ncbi:damage-inducible protein CinA [Vibrio sp. 10N.286.49.B3]|uniref:nicotinamide-nucleotide amidase n=1 Tax=Vibrio sp. 10N.286.49.B3 TaxID=1880855 RepID=UPI000C816D9C|nr:nicotinamide-nucleotide amidase [Vibrio sp. 10N.286.49.B3]PMH43828.1 damage-inducible protein CinA [Vibrio sp. 10N.286.49.B3]
MESLTRLSHQVGALLRDHQQVLTTAESCTGGGIATVITDIAGSSTWFDRAFITYSNESKMDMVDVSELTLEQHGAVSEQVVKEMAQGALRHSNATVAIAVSGIAGPGGGSADKPVGMVCFAWAEWHKEVDIQTQYFSGSRAQIRQQVIHHALSHLESKLITQQ